MRVPNLKRLAAGLLCAGLVLPSSSAFSIGLIEAYNLALQNDPVYQSAIHEHDAGSENRELARSNLRPQLAFNYSGSRNFATISQPDPYSGGKSTVYPHYVSSTSSLNFSQPIVAFDNYARYREGMAQADYGDAQFTSRQQDLLLRLLSAYVDALFAYDNLRLVTSQRDTLLEQEQVNDRMFKEGEGTKTDMLETQAKLDLAEAQLIEARDGHSANFQALEAMVGVEVKSIDGLVDGFEPKPLQPADFESWRAVALEHNPDIAAARVAVEVAKDEVAKNRAGNLPHMDFVASVGKDNASSVNTYTQDASVRSYGIQLTMPIYSGGSVSALTRQATAAYEKAKSDLDDKTNQIMLDMHKQHYAVLSSIAKIAALEKSVASAKLLVTATRQSIKGGVRINLDLLNAEQQLYIAQRDLAQARYVYMVADLRLRADAGVLSVDDLRTVAANFSAGH
ncbi:MAG TPA: TolC family outer membrane protein [Burkholderiaceae bacterium]